MSEAGDPREAAAQFCRDAGTCRIEPLGSGNINDTFVVWSSAGPFVLQKINGSVFADPLRVIRNFEKITRHLLDRRQKHGIAFQTAEPVRTMAGELFFRDCRGDFWRGQTCLATSVRRNISDLERVGRVGRTLALFHQLAADLDVATIEDPLPGFHNLPGYMAEFDRILTGQRRISGKEIDYCLESIERIRPQTTLLEDAGKAGIFMVQPIHGDPKIDNFIFGDSGEADGMLDFDTVGAGFIHYDLGDCLRSCCNRAGESGERAESVSLDLDYCRALLDGYVSQAPQLLGGPQRGYIFEAVLLIAFELGVRFFTDHLRGNSYFKVAYEGENLQRAVRQFQLVADIAGKEKEIRLIAG